ncbi:MAG: 3-deoxy-manno-octulosonate cytidylyltransferase [Haliscomenobacter sp.]|nr:3-deoxy-manno-octulosonate cytidylyltransferase [Haliscomenobacter sp.]MBK7474793.1 3-deoxy-manno-octulosonate cytidylyltransferase [Haliscomenobacter sp.]MBK8877557.1 3-deoxy-manno-octulosonate cytidylyltransferase [Haliscomenobacter sp.]
MQEPKKALGIIPARYASTRFPGKPLADIAGKSMIQRVYEQAVQADSLGLVVVATDDERIADHVRAFGGAVQLTRSDHPSGTDRCAEVASRYRAFPAVVNIQGDEPFLDPRQIDLVAKPLFSGAAHISTLAKEIRDPHVVQNPNTVKVVFETGGRALYFSRSPIPYFRGGSVEEGIQRAYFFRHIGLYGFQTEILQELTRLAPSRLELAESLEQLRWLENGYSIQVQLTEKETLGIDTPEDLEAALGFLRANPDSGF